jgi:hypothetical protein
MLAPAFACGRKAITTTPIVGAPSIVLTAF